jgi:hypothetical protein
VFISGRKRPLPTTSAAGLRPSRPIRARTRDERPRGRMWSSGRLVFAAVVRTTRTWRRSATRSCADGRRAAQPRSEEAPRGELRPSAPPPAMVAAQRLDDGPPVARPPAACRRRDRTPLAETARRSPTPLAETARRSPRPHATHRDRTPLTETARRPPPAARRPPQSLAETARRSPRPPMLASVQRVPPYAVRRRV